MWDIRVSTHQNARPYKDAFLCFGVELLPFMRMTFIVRRMSKHSDILTQKKSHLIALRNVTANSSMIGTKSSSKENTATKDT